jgi:hypothetical protein
MTTLKLIIGATILLCLPVPAESQVCFDCFVHPYSQHTETCVNDQGCNAEIRLYDEDISQYVCNAMHLGCASLRDCCGPVYDYPPIPCDSFCAGCEPSKLPKTAALNTEKEQPARITRTRKGSRLTVDRR